MAELTPIKWTAVDLKETEAPIIDAPVLTTEQKDWTSPVTTDSAGNLSTGFSPLKSQDQLDADKWIALSDKLDKFAWETVTDTPVIESTPPVVTEPVIKEDVKVDSTKIESAQDIKSKEIANKTAEDAQVTAQNEQSITAFGEAMKSGNLQWAEDIAKKNPDLRDVFNSQVKAFLWNKANVDYFKKFSWLSNEQMLSEVQSGNLVINTDQYKLLPPEQRAAFEQFKKESDAINLTDAKVTKDQFNVDNTNTISLENLVSDMNKLFSTDLKTKYNELINSEEITNTAKDLEGLQNQVNDKDDALERLWDEVRAEYPNLAMSAQNAIINDRSTDLLRAKNTLVNQYNAKLGTYQSLKSNAAQELDFYKYEDAQKKEVYMTALWLYETRRKEMREDDRIAFVEENKQLAAETQIANQKELAIFQDNLKNTWTTWGKYIDNGKWDLVYVIDWKEVSVLTWLGKSVWTSEDSSYSYQIKQNDDGTYSMFWIPKVDWLNPTIQNFDVSWEQATSWIQGTWQGNITSYGWTHDKFQWLDIDGNIGDPVTMPVAWKVLTLWKDPTWYWNTLIVQTEDWNKIRFSHLDWFNVKIWDKVWVWSVIWTLWNTWNVLKLDWNKPTAKELAAWFGSHLDIVTTWPDWKTRTGKQTEDYLNNIGVVEEEIDDTLTDRQQIFFNQQVSKFRGDPQVKAFESALSSWGDLIKSLDSISWPWDVAAIFQFMKTLDPASVVRESEFEVAASTAWTTSKPWLLLWKITEGTRLNDQQRKEFGRLAFEYIKNKGSLYDIKYEDMTRVLWNAKIWGTNLPTRITDLIWDFDKTDIKKTSWGKTYSSSSWFKYDTTWTTNKQDNFFNN